MIPLKPGPRFDGTQLCRKNGQPDDWFPTKPGPPRDETLRAIATCNVCPFCAECAAYALADPEVSGIWGGLNDYDRERIREGRIPKRLQKKGRAA